MQTMDPPATVAEAAQAAHVARRIAERNELQRQACLRGIAPRQCRPGRRQEDAMLLHTRETIYDHSPVKPTDEVVADYSGENVTDGMHHGFRTIVGSFEAKRDGDAWLSTLIYAAHINADHTKHVLRIEGNWPGQQPYGDMRAMVFRGSRA